MESSPSTSATGGRGPTTKSTRPVATSSTQPNAPTALIQGGDVTLKSVDGVEFSAHSIILSLALPVFADMFEIRSRSGGQVVDLVETGEMIDLILKFIYPRQSPQISSFDTLDKALHVAKKYQLDGMHHRLRQGLFGIARIDRGIKKGQCL